MPRHKGQRRREARDAKYTVGVDLGAADGDHSAYVAGYWEDGVFHIVEAKAAKLSEEDVAAVRERLRALSTKELSELFRRQVERRTGVVEGESVPVETDPSRLLDAGGLEP